MKVNAALFLLFSIFISCQTENTKSEPTETKSPVVGTWQLLRGTLIEKGDTTITDYTKNISFIKIINETHFAFLQHDLNKGKDTAIYSSGGGRYTLKDNVYRESLEYCTAREWEGHDFDFKITLNGDTLIQEGIEKVESAGVNRVNIEKYIRVKK